MTVKKFFKNLAALFALLTAGISASYAVFFYFDDTLKFLDSASLPENPVGIVMLPVLGSIFSIFITMFFAVLLFVLRRKIEWPLLFFHKDESIACRIFRILGYLLLAGIFYSGIRDLIVYKEFILSGLWYYASLAAAAAIGIIIVESLLTKR